ncbi:MAG TPA: hypothetical protein PKZ99_03250, partial [Azospirillaceae bacterium]|nr:hypothetical protein [Azospirillaceae bacterium]
MHPAGYAVQQAHLRLFQTALSLQVFNHPHLGVVENLPAPGGVFRRPAGVGEHPRQFLRRLVHILIGGCGVIAGHFGQLAQHLP